MGKLLPCEYEDPSLTAKTHIEKASVVVHACNHDCNSNAGGVETADTHGLQASQPTETVSWDSPNKVNRARWYHRQKHLLPA